MKTWYVKHDENQWSSAKFGFQKNLSLDIYNQITAYLLWQSLINTVCDSYDNSFQRIIYQKLSFNFTQLNVLKPSSSKTIKYLILY